MDNYWYIGRAVTLRPTEGCYQKNKQGTVVAISETRVTVKFYDSGEEVIFLKSNGQPYYSKDKQFPCYVIIMENK